MAGKPLGPLHGLPVLGEGNLGDRQASVRTIGGSRIFATRAPEDAPDVRRLHEPPARSSWARPTSPEFGWKALGDSPLTGITRNPWDLQRDDGRLHAAAARRPPRGTGAAGTGLRRRRLHPHPVLVLRARRRQGQLRSRAAVAGLQQRLRHARRTDDAHGGRRRAHAERDGGARRPGRHLSGRATRRLRRQARGRRARAPHRLQSESRHAEGRSRGRERGGRRRTGLRGAGRQGGGGQDSASRTPAR